ncbi:MAG: peptide ABC transporter substrate-binding protein [Chloroflexi bacterium]|nr:peptide ABC transporter substrate-binding protein [Chloroflexota bacterium]MCI0842679.1 peptide ABC transporter substrate-binding protein [Chloroflexota bacterium]
MMSSRLPEAPFAHHRRLWPLVAGAVGAVALLIVLIFAFLDPLGGSGREPPVRYVEGVVGANSKVNPLFVYQNEVDRDIAALVFSGLTRLSVDGTPEPALAESWDVSSDGKTYTFHLRPGVSWHTGIEFTADDVVFTYDMLGDPLLQGDPDQAQLWQSIDCAAGDAQTVTCELPEPFAPFLSFATTGILPKHILEAVTAPNMLDDPFNFAPVGTGPYRLTRMDAVHALLVANEDYYLGVPGIEEIEIRFFPTVSSAAAGIVGAEIDGLLVDLTIDPQDFLTLEDVEGAESYPFSRSAYTSLYLNNHETPLNDHFVREAIAHAVDAEAIIAELLGGRGLSADTPIAPGTWAHADVNAPQLEVELARNLLDAGGWELPPGETVRRRNNVELRFSLLTDQDPLRGAIADAIAEYLLEVGIEAVVVREPSSSLVTDFLIPREYQAAVFGWDPGADPDPYPAWHSSQAIGDGRNLAAYTSDEADAIMEAARQTTALEARRDLYVQFQELFVQDIPSVPLYYPVYTYFVSSRVDGIEPGVLFTPASRFANVHEWTASLMPDLGG